MGSSRREEAQTSSAELRLGEDQRLLTSAATILLTRFIRVSSIIVRLSLCGFVCGSLLPSYTQAASICINEVVALNDNGRVDEDGDRPDWIELFNGSGASVNLAGYGLSDEEETPFKWVFPSRALPAGGFALVFASGKNRTNTANLHANFNIRAEGERLFLTRPDGVRIDDRPGIAIPRDYSYGRQPNGSTNFVFFATPTPGTANTTTGLPAFAAAPQFSRAGGFHDTGFDLSLSSPDTGAEIRFTLDAFRPMLESPAAGR